MVIGTGSAEKLKFFSVELDAFGPHQLLQDQATGIVADYQSIRFGLVHEICVDDAAGTGHIFNDDCRSAGNVFAQMTANRA